VAVSAELDRLDPDVAERVRRSNLRVFAGYMALQAVVGVLFWTGLAASSQIRETFELLPSHHPVTDAFILADMVVGVGGSALAAWGLWSDARWTVPVVAFTTGGIVYPTLFLVCWVAMAGTGAATLAIMIPPSVLSLYVTWRTWRSSPPPT
jgi:hypothetical protein